MRARGCTPFFGRPAPPLRVTELAPQHLVALAEGADLRHLRQELPVLRLRDGLHVVPCRPSVSVGWAGGWTTRTMRDESRLRVSEGMGQREKRPLNCF